MLNYKKYNFAAKKMVINPLPIIRGLLLLTTILILVLPACKSTRSAGAEKAEDRPFTASDVEAAQRLIGIEFTRPEIDTMDNYLRRNLAAYDSMRQHPLDNAVAPVLHFDPRPDGFEMPAGQRDINWGLPGEVDLPERMSELAFYSVAELAVLLRTRQITSVGLTRFFLERLKQYDPKLEAVVTLTEEPAMEQARRADEEIASGQYRGPLHGIPYGVKDLLAVPGYPTTWGAEPYRDQVIDATATVVERLEDAGAVLIAKLSTGELAYGDIWFGGRTRNPWDLEQGSGGSSAGPAAATAAGLVPFSIGSETWGSILSPSTRCGATGLRPTYGRVSRHGAMTLSWSLDKVGPICRTAQDCALVLDAIRGPDGHDRSVVEAPFNYNAGMDLSGLRVGYLADAFEADTTLQGENDRAALAAFRELGLKMEPVDLPSEMDYGALIYLIIRAEGGAAFDELVRSNREDLLTNQGRVSRVNSLRMSRFVPAVEYIQANRHRKLLIEKMQELFEKYDLLILPTSGSDGSAIGNMTGHPVVSLPNGYDEEGHPTSIILMGRLYDEATILALAARFQEATEHEDKHPAGFGD